MKRILLVPALLLAPLSAQSTDLCLVHDFDDGQYCPKGTAIFFDPFLGAKHKNRLTENFAAMFCDNDKEIVVSDDKVFCTASGKKRVKTALQYKKEMEKKKEQEQKEAVAKQTKAGKRKTRSSSNQ